MQKSEAEQKGITLRNANLAFMDIEATGLSVEHNEITEIGGIVVRQIPKGEEGIELEEIAKIEMKVQPEHLETADSVALEMTGFDEAVWQKEAVPLKDALEEVAEKAYGAVLVGHNVSFDAMFFEKAFEEVGMEMPFHYHKLDTIGIAFAKLQKHPDVEKFSLSRLAEYFGIENKKAHTALSDARATYELYKKLMAL